MSPTTYSSSTPVSSSDPRVTDRALHTVATSSEAASQPPTLERSVMAEQEAELEEQEQCLEDQLLQEMMEKLTERQTYIRYTHHCLPQFVLRHSVNQGALLPTCSRIVDAM